MFPSAIANEPPTEGGLPFWDGLIITLLGWDGRAAE